MAAVHHPFTGFAEEFRAKGKPFMAPEQFAQAGKQRGEGLGGGAVLLLAFDVVARDRLRLLRVDREFPSLPLVACFRNDHQNPLTEVVA